jgi:hypothetical protein
MLPPLLVGVDFAVLVQEAVVRLTNLNGVHDVLHGLWLVGRHPAAALRRLQRQRNVVTASEIPTSKSNIATIRLKNKLMPLSQISNGKRGSSKHCTNKQDMNL